jgi:arginyl-tRNA synthetase
MHVGHLRSTVIGDALAAVLQALGHDVVPQNHLGDWGTQFGMLITCMAECGAADQPEFRVSDLNALYQQAKQRFDHEPDFADRARQRVVDLQKHDPPTVNLWRKLVAESARHFNAVYRRLGVRLTDEDVRGESAYNPLLPQVVQELLDQGIAVESEGAVVVFVKPYDAPMIVRKRDGGYGYDATDLAALRYRVSELHAQRLIYVTDARQAEHFEKVFDAARRAGWLDRVSAEHVAFGTVLGEDGKPFKTRSGDTVRLADLLDEAERRAATIVAEKNPDLDADRRAEVARVVGIGAIKYADLASERTRDYVFSWDRMLAMDGNTAPYLQYAYARIRSIFRKAGESEPGQLRSDQAAVDHPAERALVMQLIQFSCVVRSVGRTLQPHHLCTYLFDLATSFSAFYENCPVLRAESDSARTTRLALCHLTARTLRRGLNLLGIETLEQM